MSSHLLWHSASTQISLLDFFFCVVKVKSELFIESCIEERRSSYVMAARWTVRSAKESDKIKFNFNEVISNSQTCCFMMFNKNRIVSTLIWGQGLLIECRYLLKWNQYYHAGCHLVWIQSFPQEESTKGYTTKQDRYG